jgi:hypothetical protein
MLADNSFCACGSMEEMAARRRKEGTGKMESQFPKGQGNRIELVS